MQPILPASRFSRGRALALAFAAALAFLAGCDIPTSAPIVDSRWVVPSQSTSIGVANLLPSGVTVMADSSGFLVSASPASLSRSLAQDCDLCVPLNGSVAPVPAFVGMIALSSALPADVAAATLVGGALQVAVTNGYSFDPLRPSASASSAKGFAVITITSGGALLGKDSVNGATSALPPGGTLNRTIPLAGSVTGAAPLTMSVVVHSPGGDPVLIDASRVMSASITPTSLRVASVSVNVVNRAVSSSTTMNLEDIDSTIANHVQSGSLLMSIANPFSVSGSLTARFVPDGGVAMVKAVALSPGNSSPSVSFSAAELQTLLGHHVVLTFSGAVSGTAGSVAVSPRQIVLVNTHLDIALEVGGK
jgi:hypothetical protein